MGSAREHRDDSPRIIDPIGECVVREAPFRVAESPHVVATETPLVLTAPFGQCLALVAPTFREETGDEEDLAVFPSGAIAANEFPVGAV